MSYKLPKFIVGEMNMYSGYMDTYKGYTYRINVDYIVDLHTYEHNELGQVYIARVFMGDRLVEFLITKTNYELLLGLNYEGDK